MNIQYSQEKEYPIFSKYVNGGFLLSKLNTRRLQDTANNLGHVLQAGHSSSYQEYDIKMNVIKTKVM